MLCHHSHGKLKDVINKSQNGKNLGLGTKLGYCETWESHFNDIKISDDVFSSYFDNEQF